MKNKRKNYLVRKRHILALCLICAAGYVSAQERDENSKSTLANFSGINTVMGTLEPETSVQSISTVSGDKLQHRPVFMMEQTLDGVLPGLYVDMSQGYATEQKAIRLRGTTPLILVDGIPRSDANIPASQIESVTIIKDALALSMMGMSSGNGVLYIKTKRGQRSSLKIDFTAQLAFNQQIFRPEFLGAYDYASLLNQALINEGKSPMYSQADLTLYKTGASPFTHPDIDWQKELLRNTAPVQQYNLNLSGGGKNARYFIDLNVYDQDGFFKKDDAINTYDTSEGVRKYSLRVNTDISITENTLFKVNLFGQMFKENTPGKTVMGSIYRDMYTTPNNSYPIFNPNGTLGGTPIYKDNNLYGQTILSGYNLYSKTDFNLDASLEHRFDGILKGLYVSGTYSYNSSYRETLQRDKNFEVWSYWKDPTNPDAEEIYQQMASAGSQNNGSSYSRNNRMQYIELALGYDFNINKHNFKTKALYSYSDYMVSAQNIPMRKNAVSFKTEYNFDRRYLAEFSVAGMNLNSLKPGEQWGVFPAVGAGWNIHKESWFNIEEIDFLKLRGGYGINGSDGTGAYYRSGTGTLSNYYYTYLKYYNTNGNGVYWGSNPVGQNIVVENNLPYLSKWERITRWNFGVDVQAFDRTLSATVEYFRNIHDDVLQAAIGKSNNSLIGIDIPKENIMKYRRSGVEMNVSYNKRFGDIYFTSNANALIYNTKLLENGEYTYPEKYMQRVGEPYGQVFGYVADGLFQSQAEIDEYLSEIRISDYTPQPGDIKYRDLNDDNVIDGKDIKAIGTNAPRVEYGFYLGAEWKGLALSAQWAGLGNVETFNKIMPFTSNAKGAYGQALVEHMDYWTPENPNARYPRLTAGSNSYNERTSTFWKQSAGYLRLKNIELSYTLPKAWTKQVGLNKVKVFANAYNLLTISSIKDRDPELLMFTNGNTTGIVPNNRAYNVGINIQF